jgi:hypothetical protein
MQQSMGEAVKLTEQVALLQEQLEQSEVGPECCRVLGVYVNHVPAVSNLFVTPVVTPVVPLVGTMLRLLLVFYWPVMNVLCCCGRCSLHGVCLLNVTELR